MKKRWREGSNRRAFLSGRFFVGVCFSTPLLRLEQRRAVFTLRKQFELCLANTVRAEEARTGRWRIERGCGEGLAEVGGEGVEVDRVGVVAVVEIALAPDGVGVVELLR